MSYFAYHKSGLKMIVPADEYHDMIQSGQWFRTPFEAEKAAKLDVTLTPEKEPKKKKAKKEDVTDE
jgi:hypothetical protein